MTIAPQRHTGPSAGGHAAAGLPADAVVERVPLADGGTCEVALVAMPAASTSDEDATLAEQLSAAVAWAVDAAGGEPPLTVPLFGTHVVWTPCRCAALAPPERLPALRAGIVEFVDREAELRDIERRVTSSLEHLDGDAALAFAFDEQALPQRRELADRFREAVSLRRRLAVLASHVSRPAPQPPTLAGQVGERLRDRARIAERLEHAVEQTDLLERVYAGCGERAAEFVVSRRHLTLEWVIILLLAAEVILLAIDLLATRRT